MKFVQYRILFVENKIPFTILSEDIQKRFDEEAESLKVHHREHKVVNTYARFLDIINWMKGLAISHPNLVSTYNVGTTYGGREMLVLKIATAAATRKVWFDCGIHAREWISPATCTFMINHFINKYTMLPTDAHVARILNHFELHFMPVHNPDGYEWSHTNARLWRKNRAPNPGSTCIGTDLNRNGAHMWMTGGSSAQPCADTYAGSSAASEFEVLAVQKAINASLGEWDVYFTIHSYGLWWFTPWGYTTALPNDYAELYEKALIGVNEIRAYNRTNYVLGSGAVILYISSGATDDWAKGVANIKYSYCLELPPGQSGPDSQYGFQLPVDRAPNVGEETFRGVQAFLHSIF